MKRLLMFVGIGLVLAGCGAASLSTTPQVQGTSPAASTQSAAEAPDTDLSRTDAQGMVTVTVKPLDLVNPGETLDFEIGMNTHSVGLDMDLAALATLTTNTGLTEKASRWDAPSGGHHVSGKLSFPSLVNGTPLLKGTTELTLTIRNVDAPERTFKWELSQ